MAPSHARRGKDPWAAFTCPLAACQVSSDPGLPSATAARTRPCRAWYRRFNDFGSISDTAPSAASTRPPSASSIATHSRWTG